MKKLIFIVSIFLLFYNAYPQVRHGSSSPVGPVIDSKIKEWVNVMISDKELEKFYIDEKERDDVRLFGINKEFSLDMSNSGTVVRDPSSGEYVWYLYIESAGAASLGIVLENYRLIDGEKLYYYNYGMTDVKGPFTCANNKHNGLLPLTPVEGGRAVLEFHTRRPDGGGLKLLSVCHDVTGAFGTGRIKDEFSSSSGSCNVDINCDDGSDWQEAKRSVVRLLIVDDFYSYLGTGVMLNNTGQHNIPYLLTASHVVADESDAARIIAFFNYESPWCEGPDIDKALYSVAGADLRALNDDIDMALLELSEFPPILYRPYLAGWSAGSVKPLRSVTIHHPNGDVKKISTDNDQPVIDTYTGYQADGFWKILEWDNGTTEGGSSGAPLFNQDHRVVGYLTGGEARCGNSVNDYFARFDIAYDLGTDMQSNMRGWLDIASTGDTFVDGRDPYFPNYSESDTLFNGIDDTFLLTEYSPDGSGYTTGINSDSLISYAERFDLEARSFITDVFYYAGKSSYVNSLDSIEFFIMDDGANGPGTIIARKALAAKMVKDTFMVRIDFGKAVEVSGTIYIGYTNKYIQSAGTEQRQFAVFHSEAAVSGQGYAWFRDDNGWHNFSLHPFDPVARSLFIKAVSVINPDANFDDVINTPFDKISIYPNPASGDYLLIDASLSGELISKIIIYDNYGKTIKQYSPENTNRFVIDGMGVLKRGIYYVDIYLSSSRVVRKIIRD